MKVTINKERKEDFVHAFMHAYSNAGLGVRETRLAYAKPFIIEELRACYKVTIRGLTKRFSNLCAVAEFIYEENFDPRHVYYPPPSTKKMAERQNTKRILNGFHHEPIYKGMKQASMG